MGSQRHVRVEAASTSRQRGRGRRSPSALSLSAISVCVLVAALLCGVVAPPPAQAGPGPTAGHVSGTVTNASAAGLGGISVTAFRADGSGGWEWVSSTETTATSGSYDLGGLPTGSYRIEFRDGSGAYCPQCYNNKRTLEEANDVVVIAGVTTSGINATLVPAGHISGTVTNASAAGLGGISVTAYRSNGSGGWDYARDTSTNATSGAYALGLCAGSYRIEFRDDSGAHVRQYYNNKPGLDMADDVAVIAGATTPGINATLVAAGHISGTVRNASGARLGGVNVTAYRYNGSGDWPWEWVGGAQTFADGAYALGLPTGSYRIEFRDDSGAYVQQYFNNKPTIDMADDVVVTAGATRSGVNARLATAGRIIGTVTNARGAGLGGIWVAAYRANGFGEWDWVNGTETNATTGTYDLVGLPAGSYRIEFYDGYSGAYVTQYYDNQPTLDLADDVVVTAGATRSGIDATLAVGGHVSGMVTNAGGGGLGGINVTAYRYNGSGGWPWDRVNDTRTFADGAYDLGGLAAGSYRIEFYDDSGAYVQQYYDGQSTIDLADDVAVTVGATTFGIDATLAPGGQVTGMVTNASGAGLGGINVTAYRYTGSGDWPWEEVSNTQTLAAGAYDLGGVPMGSYRIEFRDDSGDYVGQYYNDKPTIEEAKDVAVTVGATTANINARLAVAGHVTGTVTNASGAGLGGIWVTAYRANAFGYWDWVNGTETNATTGAYDLGGLPAGSYRIEFRDGYSGAYVTQCYDNQPTLDAADDVAVTVGATTFGIDATLAVAGHVRGMVTNARGAGLGGIWVGAYRAGGSGGWEWVDSTYTAAAGAYDLGGLPTGSYRIEFWDDSGDYVQQYYDNQPTIDLADDVAVIAGATTFGIDATLAVAGHVTGTVKSARAAGLGGVWVSAYRSDGSGGWARVNSTQTAASGAYDLGGLPTGRYRIDFYDSSGAYATQCYNNQPTLDVAGDVVVIAGDTTSGIDARLATAGHITGTVRNARASGLGGIWVTAYRSNGFGDWRAVSTTDSNATSGAYDLGGLPTGSYRIEFYDGYTGAYQTQYYDNQPTIEEADDVAVIAGATISGVNATLAAGGAGGGTVTDARAAGPAGDRVTPSAQQKRGAYSTHAMIARAEAHAAATTRWHTLSVK